MLDGAGSKTKCAEALAAISKLAEREAASPRQEVGIPFDLEEPQEWQATFDWFRTLSYNNVCRPLFSKASKSESPGSTTLSTFLWYLCTGPREETCSHQAPPIVEQLPAALASQTVCCFTEHRNLATCQQAMASPKRLTAAKYHDLEP